MSQLARLLFSTLQVSFSDLIIGLKILSNKSWPGSKLNKFIILAQTQTPVMQQSLVFQGSVSNWRISYFRLSSIWVAGTLNANMEVKYFPSSDHRPCGMERRFMAPWLHGSTLDLTEVFWKLTALRKVCTCGVKQECCRSEVQMNKKYMCTMLVGYSLLPALIPRTFSRNSTFSASLQCYESPVSATQPPSISSVCHG